MKKSIKIALSILVAISMASCGKTHYAKLRPITFQEGNGLEIEISKEEFASYKVGETIYFGSLVVVDSLYTK